MEYPRTLPDQSSGTVAGTVVFQNKHVRGRHGRNTHLRVHDPSLSIKGGLARQASTSFACMGNTFESAFGVEQSLCKQCRGWRCYRSTAIIRACENIVPELSYCEQGCRLRREIR